jgi:sugar lactone lactonase YvrE
MLMSLAATHTSHTSPGSDWHLGDLFLGVAMSPQKSSHMTGDYRVFRADGTPTGEAVAQLRKNFPAGCAVEPATGYLWTTTHFGNALIGYEDLHDAGGAHAPVGTIDARRHTFLSGRAPGAVRSVGFDASGNMYAGTTDGANLLLKFSPSGELLGSYAMPGAHGVAWFDIAGDQTTVYYTSGDNIVRRYDMATRTPLPDFAPLLDGGVHALRLLPGGQGLLVAGSIYVTRLDLNGQVVSKMWLPGRQFKALTITPDGREYWTSTQFGELYRVDIASGVLLQGPVATGFEYVRSTCMKYEYTAAENVCRTLGADGQPIQTACPQF